MAAATDRDVWFLDESHFQQHGGRVAMWVPPEENDPIQWMAPTRKNISLFGAVNARTGKLITQFEKTFNADTFEDFLKRLLRHRGPDRHMVIILDNARYHHARKLKPLLRKYRRVLTLSFLPPYSPELNNIERVWKLLRRLCVHNRYFPQLEELVAAISNQADVWSKANGDLRRLCCII
jgi:transposase